MRNVFNFIVRYHFVFIFLALEVIAFAFIAKTHNHQRVYFMHSANALSGYYYKKVDNILSYFSLRSVNDNLAAENAMLLEMADMSYMQKDTTVYASEMDIFTKRFLYTPAKVINNSVMYRNNFLTIDKGSADGIEKDMGVITAFGVVGIVNNVSKNFSSVISLLHKDMQISVRLKSNNHIGTLVWEGGDYKQATMMYVPTHVELMAGDTIEASGFSKMFPEGIFIGTIHDFEIRRGENFYTAVIDLAVDFNNLRYVYVVNDLLGDELQTLESLN